MDRNILKSVIREQVQQRESLSDIPRTAMKTLLEFAKTPEIVVISGVRRCGKSTLIHQLRETQKQKDYFLNFNDDRLIHFRLEDFQLLWELLIEEFGEQDVFYFDEIQNVPGWERFVRRLHDQKKKVYVTGSNATMLSCELGTRLTGRYLQLSLFPLSFKEIVSFQLKSLSQLDAPPTVLKGKLTLLKSAETKKREIGGLQEALETYSLHSGFILTEDEEGEEEILLSTGKAAKVYIVPIWKWLVLDHDYFGSKGLV